MSSSLTRLTAVIIAAHACTVVCFAHLPVQKVALTGDSAPGTTENVVFGAAMNNVTPGFGVPQISADGRVTFSAILDGPTVVHTDPSTETFGNDSGLFSGLPGGLVLAARAGDPAPGVIGATFDDMYPGYPGNIRYNGAGGVTLQGGLRGDNLTIYNNSAIWSGTPGNLQLLARAGDPAPGAPSDVTFFLFGYDGPLANRNGEAAFDATWISPVHPPYSSTVEGLWAGTPGNVQQLQREYEPAPGPVSGALFSLLTNVGGINNLGQVSFRSLQYGPGLVDGNNGVVWISTAGHLTQAVREGDPAPGVPGSIFVRIYGARINDAGEIGIEGQMLAGGQIRNAIWTGMPGHLSLIAATGEAAPGLPTERTFSYLLGPTLNGAGKVAFLGIPRNGDTSISGRGIWTNASGDLGVIVRENQPAPGAPDGSLFIWLDPNPIMNRAGELVFDANFSVTGGELPYAHGIWAYEPRVGLFLVARDGQHLKIAPGDVRTIAAVNLAVGSGGEDGLPMSLNDSGQLTFWAAFTDGTEGLFIATLPRPGPKARAGVGSGHS